MFYRPHSLKARLCISDIDKKSTQTAINQSIPLFKCQTNSSRGTTKWGPYKLK